MIAWNPTFRCAVDSMGMPLSLKDAKAAIELLQEHLKNSPEQLAAARVGLSLQQHPEMAHMVAYDPGAMA